MNSLGNDIGDVHELARSLARRHNLVCDNGAIVCWECKQHEALLPSLHCPKCLADAWRRLGIVEPQCIQREQTEADKSLMVRKTEG